MTEPLHNSASDQTRSIFGRFNDRNFVELELRALRPHVGSSRGSPQ
jgi:hypothetical protein